MAEIWRPAERFEIGRSVNLFCAKPKRGRSICSRASRKVKIAGWHIEGFGIFQDFEVRLSDGLTVFLGPNEAGKSTLLGFLRGDAVRFPEPAQQGALSIHRCGAAGTGGG